MTVKEIEAKAEQMAAIDLARLASNIRDQDLELQRVYWSHIAVGAGKLEDVVMDVQEELEAPWAKRQARVDARAGV